MELGIYTFGDITPDPNTGRAISCVYRKPKPAHNGDEAHQGSGEKL